MKWKLKSKYDFTKKVPIIKSIGQITIFGMTDEDKPFKIIFCDFNEDKVKIEGINDDGNKTLSLIINGSYSWMVE